MDIAGPSTDREKEKFADLLFAKEQVSTTLYEEFALPLIANPDIRIDIEDNPLYLKRIQVVDGIFSPQNLRTRSKSLEGVFKKDEELAKILCERGVAKSEAGDKVRGLRYFNLALLAAPITGSQIAEIYTLRASAFLDLDDKKACVKDVNMALKFNVGPKSRVNLTKLRETLLQDCSQIQDMRSVDYFDKVKRQAYRDNVLFCIQGPPNPVIPVAAESIKVRNNPRKGRHVTTTADLAPGTTIIVENPYVSVLKGSLVWDTQHCASCSKRSSSLIPCDGCMFVMYCDEKCRQEGMKNGHQYECPCMAHLHLLKTNSLVHISFKTICKAGPAELHALFLAPKGQTPIIGSKKGLNPVTGVYDVDSYFQMSKHYAYLDIRRLPFLTVMSVILAHVLDIKTNFFEAEPEGHRRNAFIKFTASKILFHTTSISVNSFGLTEIIDEQLNAEIKLALKITTTDDPVAKEDLSTVVYPFVSLICHSCFPNAVCEHFANGRMAVVTSRGIKPGEEITISYGHYYAEDRLSLRRAALNAVYHFSCFCVACANQWPRPKCFEPKPPFLCQKCTKEFTYNLYAKKCVLTPDMDKKGICGTCKGEFDLAIVEIETDQYERKYAKARALVKEYNKPLEAIPILISCIEFFQDNICPPSNQLLDAMRLLERAQGNIYKDLE